MNVVQFFELGMDRLVPTFENHQPSDGPIVNLGIGTKPLPYGTISIGMPKWNAEIDPLPFGDGSVTTIYAMHFFEHINNFLFVLGECQRVLMPGGVLNIVVPYGTCHMAIQDQSHVRFFNEDTWKTLFDNPYYDDHGKWKFRVGTNVIMGVKGTNLALVTQLIKRA